MIDMSPQTKKINHGLLRAQLNETQFLVFIAIWTVTSEEQEKPLKWISNDTLAKMTQRSPTKCSTAKNRLVSMKLLLQEGRSVGINSNIYEWSTPSINSASSDKIFNPFTIDLPHWLPRKLWTDWVTARMDSRKPLDTEAAVKRAIDFLTERWDRGIAPDDVINTSIQHIAYTKAKNAQSHAR